jgi:hypothetical protein
MIAAMLLVISVVAMVQFAVYYWRSLLAGVAAEPLSERVREAAGLDSASVGPSDFVSFLQLNKVTPGLRDGSKGLWAVRTYYRAMETLDRLAGVKHPALAAWTEREMATCSRYVAVLVGQRLERNLVCAAEIRSC